MFNFLRCKYDTAHNGWITIQVEGQLPATTFLNTLQNSPPSTQLPDSQMFIALLFYNSMLILVSSAAWGV